jgi:molybdenum cofactor cytidylyltransferase
MQDPYGLCGIILSAGESSRMGTDKAMLPWPPPTAGAPPSRHTLLSSAILALEPHTRAVVVVAGQNAGSIATIAGACGAYIVRNPDPSRGQFSSLQIGLGAVAEHNCASAMITPVDCPPLAPSSLALLKDAFQRAVNHDRWAVAPENKGKHGHPLLIGREFIRAFLDAPVDSNARDILRAHPDRIEYIAVPDDLSRAGLNTPEEYASFADTDSSPDAT